MCACAIRDAEPNKYIVDIQIALLNSWLFRIYGETIYETGIVVASILCVPMKIS